LAQHTATQSERTPPTNQFLDALFCVTSASENGFLIELASDTHPVFQAHFESNPILPGFLHIDLIASLFCIEVEVVKKAKYLEIVRPLEKLRITMIKKQESQMSFEITKESGSIASKIELIAKATVGR